MTVKQLPTISLTSFNREIHHRSGEPQGSGAVLKINTPLSNPIRKKRWRSTSPKLRHFLWRSLSGALAVKERLRSHCINVEASCDACGHHSYPVVRCASWFVLALLNLECWCFRTPLGPHFSSPFTSLFYLCYILVLRVFLLSFLILKSHLGFLCSTLCKFYQFHTIMLGKSWYFMNFVNLKNGRTLVVANNFNILFHC